MKDNIDISRQPAQTGRKRTHRPSNPDLKCSNSVSDNEHTSALNLTGRLHCCRCPEGENKDTVEAIMVKVGNKVSKVVEGPFTICDVMKEVDDILREQQQNGEVADVTVNFKR